VLALFSGEYGEKNLASQRYTLEKRILFKYAFRTLQMNHSMTSYHWIFDTRPKLKKW
jgi:hypothetical protein